MFTIKKGVLFDAEVKVPQKPSPNHGGALKASLLVMHYTGSPSFDGAVRTLTDRKAAQRVSAHVVIGRDGAIAQLVPFETIAWHAGASSWKGRSGCNDFAIGIEMVNSGLLGKLATGEYYDRLTHKKVPAADVAIAEHKNGGGMQPWEVFPPAQIEAAIGVAQAICKTYGIRDIAGHDDIAPRRKIDPGPAFPMHSFIGRVLGRRDDEPLVA
ncbi:MAG: N-acetylmuramoyl-L-alanine amidase [Hyphomicrobiales bacterium]|nr:N-acetylmuramoyl-L-alanine amidase [Hyphomicrobiales bacterium]